MNEIANPIEKAQRRFFDALDALEATARRQRETVRGASALEAELRTLGDDRSRLAQELDKSKARAAKLEAVVKDVSYRLDTAVDTIRGVLERSSAASRSGAAE